MRIALVLTLILVGTTLSAQEVPIRKLPITLNRMQTNNSNPVLSGDGRYMIYISDLSRDGFKWWYTTKRSGGWAKQEVFDQKIDQSNVNTQGGFALSADGNTLLITSKRHGSMGGYDIWITDRKSGGWGIPLNAGKPVNSSLSEGDPSLSPDGKFLLFTRCKGMSETVANDCDLYMAERKSNGYFEEPKLLPATINASSETAPLMLSDNQTLVFASDRAGGKGGYDLYLSRKEGKNWSEPIPFDFINTENDDRYLSIPSKGDLAYFTRAEKGYQTLMMARLPEEFQPRKIIWLNGKVASAESGETIEAVLQVKNHQNGETETTAIDGAGFFSVYLAQGGDYDVSVLDPSGSHAFTSERYDLVELESSQRENHEYVLEKVRPGNELELRNVSFVENDSAVTLQSEMELRRLLYVMKKNPGISVEVDVYLSQYMEDTIQSDPDLTEVVTDTLTHMELIEKVDSVIDHRAVERLDSLLTEVNNTEIDSLDIESQEVDSIHLQLSAYKKIITYDTIYTEEIKYTYHNDRTQKQANQILKFLTLHGAPPNRLSAVGYRNRRSDAVFDPERDYYVYIKFFQ